VTVTNAGTATATNMTFSLQLVGENEATVYCVDNRGLFTMTSTSGAPISGPVVYPNGPVPDLPVGGGMTLAFRVTTRNAQYPPRYVRSAHLAYRINGQDFAERVENLPFAPYTG